MRARGVADQPDTLTVETELGGLGTHELRRGADILGTVRITEPDAFLDMLLEVCMRARVAKSAGLCKA